MNGANVKGLAVLEVIFWGVQKEGFILFCVASVGYLRRSVVAVGCL